MSTQQQEQASSKARQRKQLRERRFLILGIALLFLLGGATLWILNSQGIVRGSWSSALLIVFTVLGVVVGLFQWLFPITSPPQQQHAGRRCRPPDAAYHCTGATGRFAIATPTSSEGESSLPWHRRHTTTN